MRPDLTKRFAISLAVAIASSVLLAACGGEDTNVAGSQKHGYVPKASTTMGPASPPLSKSAFLSHMSKVCREAWPSIAYNWMAYRRTQSLQMKRRLRFADAVQKTLMPSIDFLIFDDIHMLGSPRYEEKKLERIIGPMQVAVELGEKGRWRAYTTDEVRQHFHTYNTRARRYGLDDCLVNRVHLSLNPPISSSPDSS